MNMFLVLGLFLTFNGIIASVYGAGWVDEWNKMERIKPKEYICYKTSETITIDGKLDENFWQKTPWTDDFSDIQGDTMPRPLFRTKAKMLWDNEYLYIAAELEEPHIWGTLTQHDSIIFQDNDFEIFIDPNSDNHEYYEIEINALGTEWDLLLIRPYKDGGPAVNSWEIPGLKVATHINGTINNPSDIDNGWTVEVAIPWKVLAECANRNTPPSDGEQWRINFSRVEWDVEVVNGIYRKVQGKPENNWVWSPQGVIDMHRPEKWGYAQFSTSEPGKAVFNPDSSAPIRQLLHRIYYAQRDYRQNHNRWATTLTELGLDGLKHENIEGLPEIQVTESSYEVIIKVKNPSSQRWHIRQDSRIWSD